MNKAIISILLFLISCNSRDRSEPITREVINQQFPNIEKPSAIFPNLLPNQILTDCFETPIPEFDEIKTSLRDVNGMPYKDTIIEKIVKRRTVFKPCREYKFIAIYQDRDGKILSESKLSMMATGNRWNIQPELQDEVLFQYEYNYNQAEKEIINEHNINKTLPTTVWRKRSISGIIENVKGIWMHPFRDNQFHFTEVAPFPKVKFPIEMGKSWNEDFYIGQGWGDWSSSQGECSYTIEAREDIETKYGHIPACWKIKSSAKFPFGESLLDFWFNEDLGFVKMNYTNYEGHHLNIEIIEVNDH